MDADALLTGVITGVLGSGLSWTARAGYERTLQKRPVAVRVDENIKVVFPNTPAWISFPYFIPQLPADIPPPPASVFDWWGWAKDNGGLPAIWTESVMTISVRSKASVLVDVFDVEIVKAVDAPAGSTVFQGTGGADITSRQISVELNEFVSNVKYLDQGGAEHQGGFEFALAPGEFGRLHIAVKSQDRSRLYRWRGNLVSWSTANAERSRFRTRMVSHSFFTAGAKNHGTRGMQKTAGLDSNRKSWTWRLAPVCSVSYPAARVGRPQSRWRLNWRG